MNGALYTVDHVISKSPVVKYARLAEGPWTVQTEEEEEVEEAG